MAMFLSNTMQLLYVSDSPPSLILSDFLTLSPFSILFLGRGRSLNQNWVKLNATSTISWSTIWSVYPTWPYFGNGLMYAYTPWSGAYSINPTIWTSAHTTQVSACDSDELGVFFLGGGHVNNKNNSVDGCTLIICMPVCTPILPHPIMYSYTLL